VTITECSIAATRDSDLLTALVPTVVAALLGFFAAVLAPLFKEHLARPKLEISRVYNLKGVLVPTIDAKSGHPTGRSSRYYHLQIVNRRPKYLGSRCFVGITGVSRGNNDQSKFVGFFPFPWAAMPDDEPRRPQDIDARPWNIDVLKFDEPVSGGPSSQPSLPLHFRTTQMDKYINIEANVETLVECLCVTSTAMKNIPFRIRIFWDGEWSEDSAQQGRHLSITLLDSHGKSVGKVR